jgi:hypothetical protein
MKPFYKTLLLALVAAAAAAVALSLDPIPQDPAYHRFADARALFGIPNFWNVATNLTFLVAGVLGLLQSRRLASPLLATHYRTFCGAVALVAFGSAWYHLAPDNVRLVWDRMPMTVAVMALFAAVIADRIGWIAGRALLWPLVVMGTGSIAWWIRGEATGHGDLRAYGLVQFLPMLLIPLVLMLWRGEGIAARKFWMALGAYAVAKAAEHFDAQVFAAGGLISGHSLKHLAAALATWWIVRAFQRSPASAL